MNLREANGNCLQKYITIVDDETPLEFCGIHSVVNVYTSSGFISFYVSVNVLWDTSCKVGFSVISEMIVTHQKLEENAKGIDPISIHTIIMSKIEIHTYKIFVAKYQGIQLKITSSGNVSFVNFDGPGFLSKKITGLVSSHVLHLSTYQCLLHLISKENQSLLYNIRYSGNMLPQNEINLNKSENISFNGSDLEYLKQLPDSSFRIYLLKSPTNSIVNLTITQFTFIDQPDPLCSHGGAAILENSNGTWIETKTFYNRNSDDKYVNWLTTSTIYANSNNVLLVLYSFKKYSSYEIGLTATHSYCRLTTISACESHFLGQTTSKLRTIISLNPDHCDIVQLSSGKYDVHEINKESRELTPYGNFPDCVHFIKFDQSAYGKILGHYRITGFNEGIHHPMFFLNTLGVDKEWFSGD